MRGIFARQATGSCPDAFKKKWAPTFLQGIIQEVRSDVQAGKLSGNYSGTYSGAAAKLETGISASCYQYRSTIYTPPPLVFARLREIMRAFYHENLDNYRDLCIRYPRLFFYKPSRVRYIRRM